MTIADNTTPTRSRRPSRRRAAPTRPRHRLLFPRRRATGRIRVPNADSALNFLMQERLLIAGSIVGLETEDAIDEQAPGGRRHQLPGFTRSRRARVAQGNPRTR
jgi:hypothetical protein